MRPKLRLAERRRQRLTAEQCAFSLRFSSTQRDARRPPPVGNSVQYDDPEGAAGVRRSCGPTPEDAGWISYDLARNLRRKSGIGALGVASGNIGWLNGKRPWIIGRVTIERETVTLWRPTGSEELALVEASSWREWPPRLSGQPIFYPVLERSTRP
jgi:hypothetical protein